MDTIKRQQVWAFSFQDRTTLGSSTGPPGAGCGRPAPPRPPGRPSVTQRPPPPPPTPAYAILPPAANCPGDFARRPGIYVARPSSAGIHFPAPARSLPPDPARAANYRKSAAGSEPTLRLAQHPPPSRARAASWPPAPRRSTGAPATAPGRGVGNAPRHSRLEGDPHCDRSTSGHRPFTHTPQSTHNPGPQDASPGRQLAWGADDLGPPRAVGRKGAVAGPARSPAHPAPRRRQPGPPVAPLVRQLPGWPAARARSRWPGNHFSARWLRTTRWS